MQPRNRLTPREIEVAALVWEGMTNREIGQTIGTTEQVVKNYLRKIYDKLGVSDRLELALYCVHHRLLHGSKVPQMAEQAQAAKTAAALAEPPPSDTKM